MNWNIVAQKCREVYQIDSIGTGNPVMRKQIIQAVAEEFPELPRVRIAAMVDRCLKNNNTPLPTKDFISCLQSNFL